MKRFQFLLLDACTIIKIFSLGIWDDFIKQCDVSVSRTIADDEALYTEDGTRQIDLKIYEKQNFIKILDSEPSEYMNFYEKFDQEYKSIIHPGEKETLAFLYNSKENWIICSSDGAVFRVLGLLGKSEQGVSLEEVLKDIGLSRQLEWQYTKKFREKYTRIGQLDSIQDKGVS